MVSKPRTKGLLNLEEAMDFLRVSRSKLYMLMDSGELPYIKLGKCRRVRMAALQELVEQNEHSGPRSRMTWQQQEE